MLPKTTKSAIFRRRRLIAGLVLSAVIATVATLMNVYGVGILSPGVKGKHTEQATASTRAVVVTQPAHKLLRVSDLEGLAKRATMIANVMSTPPVVGRAARLLGVAPGEIAAETDVTVGVPEAFIEPDAERRATEIVKSRAPYRVDIQPRGGEPAVDVYSQAATPGEAAALAEAMITATNEALESFAVSPGIESGRPVALRQLGAPRADAVETMGPAEIAALTFAVVFACAFGLLAGAAALRRGWIAQRDGKPNPPSKEPPPRRARDDWPHTNRILPWLLAAFILMLWLVPINAITIEASLPIDLKLDRIVLPVIALFWLLALAAGGRSAPRLRLTSVHAAVGAFVAVAFLSVVVNAVYLDHTLELGLAIKKLSLLGAFFVLFLIISTSVRPTEVRAFLTLMLVGGVVCAVGTLWEFRFDYNVFYAWSSALLPGIFHVTEPNNAVIDEIGRRSVIGPAEVGLETVAMLTMALPIGLVRLMETKETRHRIFYALAVLLLFGAMLATYRKSALLAPLTVVIVLFAFRRREMLKLAPVGIGALLAMPVVAPNALGSIVGQFRPNRLGVTTVSDRVSDYDAIRPDVLSHLLLGRGYGSYEHTSYRTLDNDLLMRLVETGLFGLSAYIVMLVGVIVIAAPVIRARRPEWAGSALAAAAASAAFLVLSVLFDILSFPHTPYLLMVLLGLLSVAVRASRAETPVGAVRHPEARRPAKATPAAAPAAEDREMVPA